ncbi:MAG: GerW family sporulation protein [Bacillota bacterium]|nr:GerW family sporulation protein [Bacillota bacterium]
MDNHPIEGLMQSTMENIRDMIDVNTIVGEAIETSDGSVILPISKVSFGFASGGSEFFGKNEHEGNPKYPFGGASGAGVSLKPVAFIVLKNDNVRLLSVDHENTYDRIIDSIPQVVDMLKGLGKNKGETKKEAEGETNKTTSDTL